MCVCVCVCVCACVRTVACVCVCVCVAQRDMEDVVATTEGAAELARDAYRCCNSILQHFCSFYSSL